MVILHGYWTLWWIYHNPKLSRAAKKAKIRDFYKQVNWNEDQLLKRYKEIKSTGGPSMERVVGALMGAFIGYSLNELVAADDKILGFIVFVVFSSACIIGLDFILNRFCLSENSIFIRPTEIEILEKKLGLKSK